MIIVALLLTAVSATEISDYDCQAQKQVALTSRGSDWSYSANDLDNSQREIFRWEFRTTKFDDGSMRVSHEAGILDALGLGGDYEPIQIAPGQIAFSTHKEANCMFTEEACTSLVEISDIDQNNASFSITPSGSLLMENGDREIFQLIMLGTCKKKEAAS